MNREAYVYLLNELNKAYKNILDDMLSHKDKENQILALIYLHKIISAVIDEMNSNE